MVAVIVPVVYTTEVTLWLYYHILGYQVVYFISLYLTVCMAAPPTVALVTVSNPFDLMHNVHKKQQFLQIISQSKTIQLLISTISRDRLDMAIFEKAFGVIYICCSLIGTPANLASLIYFCRKAHRSTSSLLHTLMNFSDLIICCLIALPPALSKLTGKALLFSWQPFCDGWYMVWITAFRYSIFLIGVVSVVRTYSIVNPLIPVSRKKIFPFLVAYFSYLVGKALFLLLHKFDIVYDENHGSCVIHIFANETLLANLLISSSFIETAAPILPISICCGITVYQLYCVGINQASYPKKRATITVIILTVIYLVCNLPYVINQSINCFDSFSNGKLDGYKPLRLYSMDIYYLIRNLSSVTTSGIVTSCINPMVFIWRMRMWKIVMKIVMKSHHQTLSMTNGFVSSNPVIVVTTPM